MAFDELVAMPAQRGNSFVRVSLVSPDYSWLETNAPSHGGAALLAFIVTSLHSFRGRVRQVFRIVEP